MDLELSDDEAAFRENVRSVLSGICPSSLVRDVYEGRSDARRAWDEMVKLDWPALGIPESLGGLGMGAVEITVLAQELGRATVPSPLLATATQFAPVILELGAPEHHQQYLPGVAAGELTGALALSKRGTWGDGDIQVNATRSENGWRLEGRAEAVLDGDSADEIVVVARASEGLGVFVVPRASLDTARPTTLDPTMPLANLVLSGVDVPSERVLVVPGERDVEAGLRRAVGQATLALAAMTVGACGQIFDVTLEYAKQREQYGRPIGSFQALKHRFANMYVSVERAEVLCHFAATTIAEADPRQVEAVSIAKAAAGECQQLVVEDGLQLHGGIGLTWEHDLHFLLMRAKTGDALFGNASHHRARLAVLLGLAGGRAA